jgi:hypothetical protein
MRSDFKTPGASAANAADCASSIHQMKSNTEEPSNGCLTLVKVGRRTVVRIARRLTNKHVAAMHQHLTNLLADCDGTARDNSDAGESWAQDSANIAAVVKAAVAEALDRPVDISQMITNSRMSVTR